ncbi:MAG: PQQ-binding-like beta-propeller repeat protein [Stenotrophomonas sp.]
MHASFRSSAAAQPQQHVWSGVLPACLLTISGLAQAQVRDLSGYWLGEIGSAREKVVIGLQLQADANDRYDMQLDLPMAHLQRLPLHGKADFNNNVLAQRSLHMALRLQGGQLAGSLLGDGEQVSLRRASRDQLPAAAAAPVNMKALPAPRWSTRLGGQIFASPTTHDGIAYIGTTAGAVSALKLDDGAVLWTTATGYPVYASALVTNDAVFVTSDGGYLHRLDRHTGREQWRSSIQASQTSREPPQPQLAAWEWQAPRPLLIDGDLYVGGADGSVQALDAENGAMRWKTQLADRIQHSPSSDGRSLFLTTEAGVVQALRLRDGKPAWQYRMASRPGAAPTVHEGRVFANDRSGVLHAIDATAGRPLWRTQFWTSWIESEPAFDGDMLYIGSSDLRKVSAIDTRNGHVHWRSDVGGWSWGTPLPVQEYLIVGMAAGKPYFLEHTAGVGLLDRRDGRLLARYEMPAGHGFQWGIAGSLATDGTMLVAADIEGVLMGFALDAMIPAHNDAATLPKHTSPQPLSDLPSSPVDRSHHNRVRTTMRLHASRHFNEDSR